MRVLLSSLTPGFIRPFASVVRELSGRGHEVVIAFHRLNWARGTRELAEEIAGLPGVRLEPEEIAPRRRDPWHELALDLRASGDLLHFAEPRFPATYTARAERRAPRPMVAIAGSRAGRAAPVRRSLRALVRVAEDAVPVIEEAREYLQAVRPDVVLFTPYIGLRTVQPDYLRAARALGLPTAVLVTSWDNLTSKSLIYPLPDRLFVWNEIQRREAEELHGVPPERVVVTGAQAFDDWLSWTPRPRPDFMRRTGLDASRPYVLYVCSAPWTRRSEVDFVFEWVRAVRRARLELADVGVLVRPHPKRPDEWRGVDTEPLGGVVVWPDEPRLPTDDDSKADYFDSIYHSAAVVGLNTTALIEAGVIGRPVLVLGAEDFRAAQVETLHFRYLLEVGGGLVQYADDVDRHADQLAAAVAAPEEAAKRAAGFVREFVRPHGEGIPATPVFVDEIERLARCGAPVQRPSAALAPVRLALWPLARRSARHAPPES